MIAVYDVVPASFLQVGDLIGYDQGTYIIKELDDDGEGIHAHVMEIDLEVVDDLYLDPHEPVDLVAYKDDYED